MGYNKKLTYWRKLDNSLSSSTFQKLFDGFKVYYVYMNYSLSNQYFIYFVYL